MEHPNLSHGPFSYKRPGTSGYTTIHDRDGRMIGAATNCAGDGAAPLTDDAIAANGRLFAASHTLCAALTAYMDTVEEAIAIGGFTEEICTKIDDARADAEAAFDTLLGRTPS